MEIGGTIPEQEETAIEDEIISFEAKEHFQTLIISDSKLENGTYYLYQNGEKYQIEY